MAGGPSRSKLVNVFHNPRGDAARQGSAPTQSTNPQNTPSSATSVPTPLSTETIQPALSSKTSDVNNTMPKYEYRNLQNITIIPTVPKHTNLSNNVIPGSNVVMVRPPTSSSKKPDTQIAIPKHMNNITIVPKHTNLSNNVIPGSNIVMVQPPTSSSKTPDVQIAMPKQTNTESSSGNMTDIKTVPLDQQVVKLLSYHVEETENSLAVTRPNTPDRCSLQEEEELAIGNIYDGTTKKRKRESVEGSDPPKKKHKVEECCRREYPSFDNWRSNVPWSPHEKRLFRFCKDTVNDKTPLTSALLKVDWLYKVKLGDTNTWISVVPKMVYDDYKFELRPFKSKNTTSFPIQWEPCITVSMIETLHDSPTDIGKAFNEAAAKRKYAEEVLCTAALVTVKDACGSWQFPIGMSYERMRDIAIWENNSGANKVFEKYLQSIFFIPE